MNRRRSAIAMLALAALAASTDVEAQSSERPRRLGVLAFSNPVAGRAYFAAFTDELGKLGWVEGQNLQLSYRYADGDVARLPALAAELVALGPDVLFSSNIPGSIALARATSRIPIVMSGPNDPVAMGLVTSLARPGGNVTGTASAVGNDIVGKRLEIMKQWLPRFSRLAVLHDSNDPSESGGAAAFAALQDYANRLGLRIDSLSLGNPSEIRGAVDALAKHPPDAIYLFNSAAIYTNREVICAEALRMRVPTIATYSELVDAGCLAAYSYSLDPVAREGARFVNQILRGANPADIPVRQPTHLELVINARTATSLGLAIPPKLRVIADRVI